MYWTVSQLTDLTSILWVKSLDNVSANTSLFLGTDDSVTCQITLKYSTSFMLIVLAVMFLFNIRALTITLFLFFFFPHFGCVFLPVCLLIFFGMWFNCSDNLLTQVNTSLLIPIFTEHTLCLAARSESLIRLCTQLQAGTGQSPCSGGCR